MTGPEHYAEAERLLALAPESLDPYSERMVVAAQAHALLALVSVGLFASAYPTPVLREQKKRHWWET